MNEIKCLTLNDALRDPDARKLFDRAVEQVKSGEAQPQKLSLGVGLAVGDKIIRGEDVLEYAISFVPADAFSFEDARDFSERMRRLLGWETIEYTLESWVENRLCKPYYTKDHGEWGDFLAVEIFGEWRLKPDADARHLPEPFFQFACYVAICNLKYGPSWGSVTANMIFDWVTGLGSDLPAKLKKHGTGELPTELAEFKGETDAADVTIKANDALAVIRVTMKEEREGAYSVILDYLHRLFATTDFPRSYSIEFRGPNKQYLPIKGLPKKGVHQLFACAAEYPNLWPAIEKYARLVMSEYEWYQNIDDENPAMPGTFAVFALGLNSSQFAPLVLDYLKTLDGEHQSMQAKFVEAYLDNHGFTSEGVVYLVACAGNIQHMRPRKQYAAMIANHESLQALIDVRSAVAGQGSSGISTLTANLLGAAAEDHAWRHALYAIWGDAAEQRDANGRVGTKIIDRAPVDLRPLYQEIFS